MSGSTSLMKYAGGGSVTTSQQNQSATEIPQGTASAGTYYPSDGGHARQVSLPPSLHPYLNPHTRRATDRDGRERALRHFERSIPNYQRPVNDADQGGPCTRATGSIKSWATWVAKGVSSVVDGLTLLPGAAAAQPPEDDTEVVLGQGGYLVSRFDFGKYQTGQEKQQEISNYKELIPSIEAVAGKGAVVPFGDAHSDYPRNMLSEGPNSMVTSDVSKLGDPRKTKTLQDIESVLKTKGIKSEKVSQPVNFADVDFRPSAHLLVLAHNAHDPGSPLRNEHVKNELIRVFGNPKNVITYELDATAVDKLGRPKCYDGDLVMHLMRNKDGEDVALVHKPCIVKEPAKSGIMSRKQVLQTLKDLRFRTIDISDSDQAELAVNVLSIDGKPGHVLLPSDKISESLKKKLEANGIVAHYPVGVKLLGGKLAPQIPMYAVHCLSVNLRRPEKQIEQLQKEKERSNDGKADL